MNITLTELLDKGVNDLSSFLRFKQARGNNVIFWGNPIEGTRNIDAVIFQKLPLTIELISPEDCMASDYLKSKYGAAVSIPESSRIQIVL